mgnify:CR=1 FL=1
MTIPYPNTQPTPNIVTVTPPSGAARPRLTFLGTGYLGATYAICFAELGYEVLGFDVDESKVASINAGLISEIVARRSVLIDIDPDRPSGISATASSGVPNVCSR